MKKDRMKNIIRHRRPNMCNLKGTYGKAVIAEICNSKAPNLDDVKKDADESMKKLIELRKQD